MSNSKTLYRFRINPVELTLFSVISLIFCHSIYNLFHDFSSFQPTALAKMHSNPIFERRSLASISNFSETIHIRCDQTHEITKISKIRIVSPLCGLSEEQKETQAIKVSIKNTTSNFEVTGFIDDLKSEFYTEFIPLMTGINSIRIEITYKNNQIFKQELVISHELEK